VREVRAACPLVTPQGAAGVPARLIQLANPVSREHLKGGDYLTIALSAVVVLSVVVILLCRYARLRLSHAAVCIMLGFYLASSSLAPDISKFASSLLRML
jgi:hypothetical protein